MVLAEIDPTHRRVRSETPVACCSAKRPSSEAAPDAPESQDTSRPPRRPCSRRSTCEAPSLERVFGTLARARSTTPTSTSSTRATRAGAWRRASSSPAASTSSRASACARLRREDRLRLLRRDQPRRAAGRGQGDARHRRRGAGEANQVQSGRKAAGRRSTATIDPIASLPSESTRSRCSRSWRRSAARSTRASRR